MPRLMTALVLVVSLLSCHHLFAGDWTAEGEFRVSDADSQSWLLSLDRSLGENGLLFTSLGETRVDSDNADLDTRRFSFGGLYRLDEDQRLSAFVERWGRRGDLLSDRFSLTWSRDHERFGWSLTGGSRWIRLAAGAPAGDPGDEEGDPGQRPGLPVTPPDPEDEEDDGHVTAEDFDLRALHLGIRGRYALNEDWTLAAGYTAHDYNEDPRQLATRDQVERLSESAVSLAQGFLDRSVYFEARRDLGDYREFSVYLARDRSAVDGRDADSLVLSYLQPLGVSWDLRVEAGRTRTEDFDPSHFLGLGLVWYP